MKVGDLVKHRYNQPDSPMLGTILEAYFDIPDGNKGTITSLFTVAWSGAGLDTCFEKNLILVNSADDKKE
tara:strand:+ start:727 stop:936 length:210 start_codon:yes stop_codon:yes gene_type:complete